MSEVKKNILLVEDEVLLAMSEKMQLEQYGYAVKTVNTGEKAVEAVQTSSDIDLILMDINLGRGIDGTESAEIILQDRDIPVVFLSSHTNPEVVEKAEKITSYGYVVKNSSMTVLDASIKMAFKLFEAKLERERVEKQLRFQAMVLDQIEDRVTVTDLAGRITYVNEAAVRALGYNRNELVGASTENFGDDPERGATQLGVLQETLRNGEWRGEIVNRTADDRELILSCRTQLIRDDEDNPIALCSITTDITDREQMERELQESEEKFRALFEKGPIGVAYHEMVYDGTGRAIDYRFLDANSSYRELTGVDPRGKLATEAFPGIENDPFDWIGTFGRVAATGDEIRFEQYLQPNDRWYDCVGYQVKPGHFVAAFVEITDRKRAEQAMLEQRNFAERLVETARTMILVLDTHGNILQFNPYTAEILGYGLEEVKGKNWIDKFVPPHAKTAVKEVLQKTAEDDETSAHVNPIVVRDGRVLFIEWYNTTLKDAHGQTTGVLATGIDQTAQENAEAAHHLHDQIIEAIQDAVIVTDSAGVITFYNSAAANLYQFPTDSAVGTSISEVIPCGRKTDTARVHGPLCAIADHAQWTGEQLIEPADGKVFTVSISNSSIIDTRGELESIVSVSRRLHYGSPFRTEKTDAHYLENELFELIQRDSTIFTFLREGSLDGMWYWDTEKPEHEWMDNRFWELLGYDPATKRHDPTEWQDLIHPDDLKVALENFHKHLEDPNHPYDQVVRYTHKDGRTVFVRCRGLAIRDERGKPRRMLGVHNDITELMKTIETEKVLRHELNHRVKNNLAIVQSLISLKQSQEEGTADLSDILHQVDTVRVLHEQLQGSDELTTLELKPYLRSILASMFSSAVHVDVSGLDVEVTTKVAVPLGLVINELATNAAKHAFSNTEEPRFTVNVFESNEEENRVSVSVSNTGPPFPAHVDLDNASSHGMRLISSLVDQLESTFVLTREPHPVFEFDVEYQTLLDSQMTRA